MKKYTPSPRTDNKKAPDEAENLKPGLCAYAQEEKISESVISLYLLVFRRKPRLSAIFGDLIFF